MACSDVSESEAEEEKETFADSGSEGESPGVAQNGPAEEDAEGSEVDVSEVDESEIDEEAPAVGHFSEASGDDNASGSRFSGPADADECIESDGSDNGSLTESEAGEHPFAFAQADLLTQWT